MTIVFVLWIFTANYSAPIEMFPDPALCAGVAIETSELLGRDPKPFLFRLACVPRMVTGPQQTPSRDSDY